ncbi:MAG: S9 family peptidase, partial [Acidobacteriota bacterium]
NRGYAVLQINFRGSTGFGKRFLHAGDKEWGRKMQHDLTDAVQWAITERIADPQRIAIMGGSYGGYAALAGITFTPDLYAAAVSIVGPSSLFTLIASIPPYWEPVKQKFMLQVGDPDSDAEMLRERSPLFHVERIQTPLLIGQGANDPRVKQHESEQIVEAMRTSEKQVGYVLFPDEGHGFARPENRLQFFGHVEKFLARHLGGRCEPLPEDQHGGSGIER